MRVTPGQLNSTRTRLPISSDKRRNSRRIGIKLGFQHRHANNAILELLRYTIVIERLASPLLERQSTHLLL